MSLFPLLSRQGLNLDISQSDLRRGIVGGLARCLRCRLAGVSWPEQPYGAIRISSMAQGRAVSSAVFL